MRTKKQLFFLIHELLSFLYELLKFVFPPPLRNYFFLNHQNWKKQKPSLLNSRRKTNIANSLVLIWLFTFAVCPFPVETTTTFSTTETTSLFQTTGTSVKTAQLRETSTMNGSINSWQKTPDSIPSDFTSITYGSTAIIATYSPWMNSIQTENKLSNTDSTPGMVRSTTGEPNTSSTWNVTKQTAMVPVNRSDAQSWQGVGCECHHLYPFKLICIICSVFIPIETGWALSGWIQQATQRFEYVWTAQISPGGWIAEFIVMFTREYRHNIRLIPEFRYE